VNARNLGITESVKAIFIPQDYSTLNLKSTLDSNNTVVPQRLCMLITGGPPSQVGVGRITLTQNWEGVPAITSSDFMTSSYNPYPATFDCREVYDYIVSNNLIITKDSNEFGLSRFIEYFNSK
jgi:hypothetical protein